MTLTLPSGPESGGRLDAADRRAQPGGVAARSSQASMAWLDPSRVPVLLSQPGFTERALVILTTFVLIHETPNVWFKTRADLLATQSNPIAVLLSLGLIMIAVVRIIGSIDHLLTVAKSDLAAVAFAGMTFASTFWSADPAETAEKSVVFISITIYAAYLVMRFSLQEIVKLLALMFTVSALLNTATVFGLPVYGVSSGGEFTGVFSQKNALGFVATIAIPTLIVAGKSSPRWRMVFYPTAALQLMLLLGSQSKTMLLATVGPVALMVVYHLFRGKHTLRGAVMLSLAGSTVFTVFFATANIGLLADWLDKDVTLTGRVPLWQNLMPIAMESPFFGHGYKATFNGYYSPVHEVWIQNQWNPTHAHNAALQIVLEIGLFGLIPFLICYFRGIGRAIKIVAIVPGAIGLWPLTFLTTTLLVSLTESGMSSNRIGWMMFMVSVLSVSLHLRHRESLGLSNELHEAVEANMVSRLIR